MTDVEGFVRWPTPDDREWIGGRSVPKGYRLAVVDEFCRKASGWRRLAQPRLCRYTVGPRHQSCRRPAVVELARGMRSTRQWWGYCSEHLYGRRWESPRLLAAILVDSEQS